MRRQHGGHAIAAGKCAGAQVDHRRPVGKHHCITGPDRVHHHKACQRLGQRLCKEPGQCRRRCGTRLCGLYAGHGNIVADAFIDDIYRVLPFPHGRDHRADIGLHEGSARELPLTTCRHIQHAHDGRGMFGEGEAWSCCGSMHRRCLHPDRACPPPRACRDFPEGPGPWYRYVGYRFRSGVDAFRRSDLAGRGQHGLGDPLCQPRPATAPVDPFSGHGFPAGIRLTDNPCCVVNCNCVVINSEK